MILNLQFNLLTQSKTYILLNLHHCLTPRRAQARVYLAPIGPFLATQPSLVPAVPQWAARDRSTPLLSNLTLKIKRLVGFFYAPR